MLKIADYILIVGLIAFAIAFNFIFFRTDKTLPSEALVVTVGGEVIETYDLSVDGVFTLETGDNHTNTFEIKEGVVKMLDANCPDKNCLTFAPIHYNNEIIVCLPNEMILEILSDNPEKESEIDSIAQ